MWITRATRRHSCGELVYNYVQNLWKTRYFLVIAWIFRWIQKNFCNPKPVHEGYELLRFGPEIQEVFHKLSTEPSPGLNTKGRL
jgi:hypothetical protein